MRAAVIKQLFDHAGRRKDIFLVTGDAGFGVLDTFRDRFPRRFLNLGVAEQNMIGFSAGLALSGYKVFIYNIIPFLLYRCYEQVRNDICYQRLPVTLIGIGSGVTYAPQGVTHYSIEDIAVARTMPGLAILSPSDPLEAAACLEYAVKAKGPVFIRLAKSGEACLHGRPVKDISRPIVLAEGAKVAVLFHGSVSCEVAAAVKLAGHAVRVISLPCLVPLNGEALSDRLRGIETAITVEEHFVEGGLGTIVTEWAATQRRPPKIKRLGIANEYIHHIKNNAGMRAHYGINAASVAQAIKDAFHE